MIIGQNDYAQALNGTIWKGKLPDAETEVNQALAVYAKLIDEDNLVNADAWSLDGQILRDSKRPAQAEQALKRAVSNT